MSGPTSGQVADLKASGFFDADWYRATYPDVDALGMDPMQHYLRIGHLMNRDPGPEFSVRFARTAYSIKSKQEPLSYIAAQASSSAKRLQPPTERLLQAAGNVCLAGNYSLALKLAEQTMPDDLRHTVHLLRANEAVVNGNTQGWLRHTNDYLRHFEVSPISLAPTEGDLFDRILAGPMPPITGGALVSVLMPAWNAEATVKRAAESILNQTWKNLELLIVDDASTDGTWSILQELASKDSRVKIFRNSENVGPYVSKNIASTQARGKWITGHDADDWALPERIALQVEFCEKEQVDASMSGILRVASSGEFVQFNKIGGFVHDGACRAGLISLMLNTQFFRDVLGSWDNVRAAGDSELLRRFEVLQGAPARQLPKVTILCLDNPQGLTNAGELGRRSDGRPSAIRVTYRDNYREWHKTLKRENARLEFRNPKRRVDAPDDILSDKKAVQSLIQSYQKSGMQIAQSIDVDVAIVTDTRYPGGNASSTLDELDFLKKAGLRYVLVNCPADANLGRDISTRYDRHADKWVNWSEISRLKTRVLICRHPTVLTGSAFKSLVTKISAKHAYIVKNNSWRRADGRAVYILSKFIEMGKSIPAEQTTFCPISPAMRDELRKYGRKTGKVFTLSNEDWTPTFDLSLYHQQPKPRMVAPFTIGRHGRDGIEKWHEDVKKLRKIYPAQSDFKVSILGGAKQAKVILGKLPKNWNVHDFGSIEPFEYLSNLDVFVYFPNTGLSEAFGRTIVEAMLAGVPVILPRDFSSTFGDLPIYCEPLDVADTVRRLALRDKERVKYLKEVQKIAVERYSSQVIVRRLSDAGLTQLSSSRSDNNLSLSAESAAYRSEVMQEMRKEKE